MMRYVQPRSRHQVHIADTLEAGRDVGFGVAKLAGEHYMASFYHSCGFETVSLRYFNVAGPRQDPSCPYSGVLARFTTQMLAGEQPTIFGDVEQSPDFTYIANVVQANLLAASAPPEQCAGRVFNVGAGGWKQLPASVEPR